MDSGRQALDFLDGQISMFDILEAMENEGLSDRGSEGHRGQGENGSSSDVRIDQDIETHGRRHQTGSTDGETSLS